jgi:hypothetical protein
MLLLNAFSLNMISTFPVEVHIHEISLDEARRLAPCVSSAVGHADTAAVFSSVLGVPVPDNRKTITLKKGDMALVGQYRGPRLPVGSTSLPPGTAIQWFLVEITCGSL